MKPLLLLLSLSLGLLWLELQTGLCQQGRQREDHAESRLRTGRKRTRTRGGSILTQVLDKGRFLRLGDTLILNPGKTLELRCKGSKIGWAYPAYLDTFNDTRLSIKQHEKFSQLTLTSPSAADTGEYSCWVVLCDGDECEKDPDRSSTTYIYVTDKDELFVPSPMHFEIVYVQAEQTAVVPCRVTSPQTQVSLHREVPPEEILVDGNLVSYSPTKGFVLQNSGPEYQGAFYCKAATKSTSRISSKYMLLYVDVPSGPPFATLKASAHVTGDRFNITCTVLGEPEVEVNFSWSFPGQDRHPVGIQNISRLIHRGVGHTTRISQSIITIQDVEESLDLGEFICTAKNKHGETSVAVQDA
ncbi:platelet-derived growth factor receptor-like protein [Denticeps clupeoides]|uniref:Platelet-derived growth factor receptor-like protein n=1 Tax=Denticeps clupeoides TaxID=299321 RepID=A0AAY4D7T5_9TELE|nr:platelet-derived growth factor receptor-like protein [Denticeps clupeoides]